MYRGGAGLVVIVYFNRAIHKGAKILIRRSTIVVLPNANWCSAPQLQNSISASRNYSTLATQKCSEENFKLNPWWLSGFVDGEGCFHVSIFKNKTSKLERAVKPSFIIALHEKEKPLLEAIKKSLGVGYITKHGPKSIQLRVGSIKELEIVINHLDKIPLITKKRADFKLLKMVIIKMKRKEHLTYEGLGKIVALRAAMNLGLPKKHLIAFGDVVRLERPLVELPQTINPHWLSGFTSAEGCFLVKVSPSKTKVGHLVQLVFTISQHSRDEQILLCIIAYLNCGHVNKDRDAFNYRVTKFSDIEEKIIPFFLKYPIKGVKALDFKDFCRTWELMKEKKHLTAEGLEVIKKIKAGMNRGRKI